MKNEKVDLKKEIMDKLTWLWLDLHSGKEVHDWLDFGNKTVELIEQLLKQKDEEFVRDLDKANTLGCEMQFENLKGSKDKSDRIYERFKKLKSKYNNPKNS